MCSNHYKFSALMSLRSRDNVQAKCTELVVIRARMSDLLWHALWTSYATFIRGYMIVVLEGVFADSAVGGSLHNIALQTLQFNLIKYTSLGEKWAWGRGTCRPHCRENINAW